MSDRKFKSCMIDAYNNAYADIDTLKYEFNAGKYLHKAEKSIHEAVLDGNYVWILTSDGRTITLDEKCKIGYAKKYI